ncbi:MAG: citrate/2-methylcitrate synthase [Planctomycetota bacterium]|nr:MAG: citrate/2-methylcitrate synthase [Planctomycetota bacterium]REK20472.1 MAG: citrate/2-methylcitrate synthase [Planctomycetota bacterium]REK33864.1 MAG: citrate/2-methylcitrate synthase [Planctomycetota bacterium]
MAIELYHPGLRGIVVGETEISRLDGGLQYRGYPIQQLAREASFLEVAYLLFYEDLPSPVELADFYSILAEDAVLPPETGWLFEQLPLHVSPVEAVRTGVSLLAHFDPAAQDEGEAAVEAQARRVLARLPLLVAAADRLRSGRPAGRFDPEMGFGANILHLLTGRRPCVLDERALETALIVSAEQEFNPSTYAARVVASTRAGLYASVLAGLGTVIGPDHGGGNDGVLRIVHEVGDAERAREWVESLPEDASVPGFGHPVYRDADPRAVILSEVCLELADARGEVELERTARAIEVAIHERWKRPANLDWPLARVFHYLGLPPELHLPLFICARSVGWCAHAIEQMRDGQLIRPRARYRGAEDLTYVPLHERA